MKSSMSSMRATGGERKSGGARRAAPRLRGERVFSSASWPPRRFASPISSPLFTPPLLGGTAPLPPPRPESLSEPAYAAGTLTGPEVRVLDHGERLLVEGRELGEHVGRDARVLDEHRRHGRRRLFLLAAQLRFVLLDPELIGRDHALARDVALAI